jgi:hypothetical protein
MTSVRTKDLDIKVIKGGPKDGIPVLLVHGWPDNATTWEKVPQHLHQAGFRTIAPMPFLPIALGRSAFRPPQSQARSEDQRDQNTQYANCLLSRQIGRRHATKNDREHV